MVSQLNVKISLRKESNLRLYQITFDEDLDRGGDGVAGVGGPRGLWSEQRGFRLLEASVSNDNLKAV